MTRRNSKTAAKAFGLGLMLPMQSPGVEFIIHRGRLRSDRKAYHEEVKQ